MRKSLLLLCLLGALAFAGFNWIDAHVEVVTLHVRGHLKDHYPTVFIVDDPPNIWIRAERPDRLWLASLRVDPELSVRRAGRDISYQAQIWNGTGGHRQVDELFRAKYGIFDTLSGWVWRRNAIPIRLEAR